MRDGVWGATLVIAGVAVIAACSADERTVGVRPIQGQLVNFTREGGEKAAFEFTPLASSTACTVGGDAARPFTLPAGFAQMNVASEPDYGDVPDMNTQNESGRDAGRYLYQPHELGSNGSVSVIDLETGVTRTVAQRANWEALDPDVWTPWGTLLIGEETNAAARRDPDFPQAVGGLVYELFPNRANPAVIDRIVARPAIGAKSHEGMRFDIYGNLYSISERTPGYLFKFTPDRKGDLSSGQTYVLKVTQPDGDRTGLATWVPLDRAAVQIDASAAGDAVGATGYGRPEDVEIATSSGSSRDGINTLYVAITSEHRVLAIDLAPNDEAIGDGEEGDHGDRARGQSTAYVYDYVRIGLNTTSEFEMPDNLALDHAGNLYIAEDPGGNFAGGKRRGDDIWVATPAGGRHRAAASVVRFASLTDCEAEPTGLYFDLNSSALFVNAQHRGGDRLDKTVKIVSSAKHEE